MGSFNFANTSSVTLTFNGKEIPGVRNITVSYCGSSPNNVTYDVNIIGSDTIVPGHQSDCTIDLNGVIDNEVTGPYLYCSCGILLKVQSSAKPFKEMVQRVVASGLSGLPQDLAKVASMQKRVNEQISILQGLLGVLDSYADKEMSQLTEWAREPTVDTDLQRQALESEQGEE
jgi:hypothetical protein